MITIKRSADKKFYVVVTGKKNEVLSTSETLNSKRSAMKNIKAQWQEFDGRYLSNVVIKDETKTK